MIDTLVPVPVVEGNFLSAPSLIILLAIILLLFGGQKLPEVARSIGQALRAFKDEASKLQRDVSLDEAKPSPASTASAGSKQAPIDVTAEPKGQKAK